MCGRFDVDQSNREIDRLLSQLPADGPKVKVGEVFPTNNSLTLVLRNGAIAPEAMAWGFPRWDGKGVIFNARSESALQKPLFKKALLQNPAVIPATGFYEWRQNPLTDRKDKFRFSVPDQELLYLAGFWNTFADEAVPRHFTILTTAANQSMQPYHSRMPILIVKEEILPWLTGEKRQQIMAREPGPVLASGAIY